MNNDLVRYISDGIAMIPSDLGLEGVVVLDRYSNVLFEKRWVDDYPRDIYSNTKSFTSAAVGMAIYDGFLSLEDRPIDYFRNEASSGLDENWNKLTLADLLTMRSGISSPQLMYFDRRAGIGACNYLSHMMSQIITNPPGTAYQYSTGDSILAGCMVEAAIGSSLISYLYENYFQLVDIEYPIWESDLSGHSCGGSGLCLKLVDMAKLGVLYLNRGVAGGKRLFAESWVASSFYPHVQTRHGFFSWGYGYYWKQARGLNVYRASGSFGQDTFVFPSLDLVLGMQCRPGTAAAQPVYKLLECFLNNMTEQ